MRPWSLVTVVTLVLVACSPPDHEAEREALRNETAERRAEQVLDLYHAWDDVLAAGIVGTAPRTLAYWRENIEWLRPRLGTCGPPERVDARCKGSHGRFRYTCENGALELEPWIDYGLIGDVRFGGRGIEAPEDVRAYAEEVVAALPLGDPELDRWPAGDDFINDFAAGLGRCEISGTDIVGVSGALFYLQCDGGPAHFKITLDTDGEPRKLMLTKPQSARYHLPGPRGV